MSDDPFDHLDPAAEPLLNLVFARVDEGMLREIAEADYGMDVQAHLAALRAIKAFDVPAPMEWEPAEVLELIRWSEPEDPTWKPGSTGLRGHWMRLFSCAVLIRAGAEPENNGHFLGEESTIIQLIDSALKLGVEASLAALRFLCWRMRYRQLDEDERPGFAAGILLLSVSLGQCPEHTAEFLVAAANFEAFDMGQRRQKWTEVIRRTLLADDMKNEKSRTFGKALIQDQNGE